MRTPASLILLTVAISLAFPAAARAACTGSSPIWTCTPDRASLDGLINGGLPGTVQDGDTINVSAGSASWSSPLTITDKAISLIGAGIGNTVITGTSGGQYATFIVTTKATGSSPPGFFRISGFTLLATSCSGGDQAGTLLIKGRSPNVRFDHNRISITACGGLRTDGDIRGVVDHNILENNGASGGHITGLQHDLWAGISSAASHNYGDGSWAEPSSMGTAHALYLEDNVIRNNVGDHTAGNGQYCTNDWKGSRTVYRFNQWTDCSYQTHGTESGGRGRGFRHVEHYRQTFSWAPQMWPSLIALRGGTGRLFDNRMTGSLQRVIDFNTYRRTYGAFQYYPFGGCGRYPVTSITRSGTTATATFVGPTWIIGSSASYHTITGANEPSFNGTFLMTPTNPKGQTFTFTVPNAGPTSATGTMKVAGAFDGNTNDTGYPCMDQLGRGQGILIRGTEPGYSAPDPNPARWAGNALDPLYMWNNMHNGMLGRGDDNAPLDVTEENRDFYNQNLAFNGSAGIGRGPRSSRPSTCTAGTAWWATDGGGNWNRSTTETYSSTPGEDGGLDYCSAANTWTNDWYVPYVYPHPLVAGSVDVTKPAAPTNVRILP